MNKAELVAELSTKCDITKAKANEVVSSLVDTIQTAVANGDRVNLAGLGVFESAVRTARKGHNPLTGEGLDIPAKNVVRYKSSKSFVEALN